MNLDLINRGVSPNDGTGDTLRDGAGKINNNFLKLLAAHASQTGNPAGGLNADDVLPGFRPDNPSDRSEGGTDFGVTVGAFLAFIASNMSTSQLNELLKREIAITVSNSASVGNLPGRLPITASIVDTGKFVLTCPSGYVWHTAVGSGNNEAELRSITTYGVGARELGVSVFNASGVPQTVSFYLMGTLREA